MVLFLVFLQIDLDADSDNPKFADGNDYVFFFVQLAAGGVVWGTMTFGIVWVFMFMTEVRGPPIKGPSYSAIAFILTKT